MFEKKIHKLVAFTVWTIELSCSPAQLAVAAGAEAATCSSLNHFKTLSDCGTVCEKLHFNSD